MRLMVVASALWVASCARPGAASTLPAPAARAAESDSLDLQFHGLSDSLRHEGLQRGALLERGFLPPSARTAFPVRVAAHECAVFVALATASMADLDASLFTSEGQPLVEDDSVSSRPTLTLCASEQPIAAYLTLHAYQGAGSFIAAQFTRSARATDDLQLALDAHGISALGQLSQLLHERGFEDAAPRVELSLGDDRPVRMALHVDAGECYTLAAEPSGGLSEVGLRLVDAQGGELADGVLEPKLAALQYCADQRAELAIEVVAKRGLGVARIARFRAAQAQVGGARALWLVEPTPSSAASAAKSESGEPARKHALSQQRVALKQGQVIELEQKRGAACERWEARLEPGLWRATLRVENEAGVVLGEETAQRMRACVQVCDASRIHRAVLVGQAGFGGVALTVTDAARDQDSTPAPCAGCADERCAISSGRR